MSPKNSTPPPCDGALLRLGLSHLDTGLKLASKITAQGKPVINSPVAVAYCKNKWTCHQELEMHDIPQLFTKLIRNADELSDFEFPLILKSLFGSKGVGVHLCHNIEEATQQLDHHSRSDYLLLYQPYMHKAQELRVFVVGDKIVASVERYAAEGEFRANWHRGGKYITHQHCTPELEELSFKVMKALQLDYAAIDFIHDGEKFCVLEANDSPGLQGIDEALGIELAPLILELLVQKS